MTARKLILQRMASYTLVIVMITCYGISNEVDSAAVPAAGILRLPEPRRHGKLSLEAALEHRRSIREYKAEPVRLQEVSQLLWAAQGITGADGRRTAPSAGATYPLELYLVAGKVTGLAPGFDRYRPVEHALIRIRGEDLRVPLAKAALGQDLIQHGPMVFAVTVVIEHTARRYRSRAERYAHLEAGHAAQNVLLQAVTLGLDAVSIGAFHDGEVKRLLALTENEHPLYLLPAGRPSDR